MTANFPSSNSSSSPGALPPPELTARTIHRHVIWAAAITALGGLLFGYDTGVISGALLFLHIDFGPLSSIDKELATSLLLVGAMIGAMFAGRIADRIGRRPVVLITAALFIAGVLAAAFSPTFGFLLAMRVVIGLAVGSSSMVVPLYIGEAAPPQIRGALVSFNQLASPRASSPPTWSTTGLPPATTGGSCSAWPRSPQPRCSRACCSSVKARTG